MPPLLVHRESVGATPYEVRRRLLLGSLRATLKRVGGTTSALERFPINCGRYQFRRTHTVMQRKTRRSIKRTARVVVVAGVMAIVVICAMYFRPAPLDTITEKDLPDNARIAALVYDKYYRDVDLTKRAEYPKGHTISIRKKKLSDNTCCVEVSSFAEFCPGARISSGPIPTTFYSRYFLSRRQGAWSVEADDTVSRSYRMNGQ